MHLAYEGGEFLCKEERGKKKKNVPLVRQVHLRPNGSASHIRGMGKKSRCGVFLGEGRDSIAEI